MKTIRQLKQKSGEMLRKFLHGKNGELHHSHFAIPSEIQMVFREFAEGNDCLSEAGFQKFLQQCQKETESATVGDMSVFNLDNFLEYLLDPEKNLAINIQVHQDMTRPLANYFIWTGHNSYLTGNQLSSDCGTEPIIRALRKGVRVIELDIWPDTDGEEVMVLHGRTMTKPVPFKDCIDAIKENAFVASEYPVIITLEDHLKPELQKKAGKIVTQAFGDLLYRTDIERPLTSFPSPEECKGRVLISTKPPVKKEADSEPVEVAVVKDKKSRRGRRSRVSLVNYEWGEELQPVQMPIEAVKSDRSDGSAMAVVEAAAEDEDEDEGEGEVEEVKDQQYLRMISIKGGKISSKDYESALRRKREEVQRVSLSENALAKVTKIFPEDLIRFTQNNLLRIFPSASRIDSSNYNPTLAWLHGAQMAAFNMQGVGRPLWLMDGFFRANGGCGYVLKPDYLLNPVISKPESEDDSTSSRNIPATPSCSSISAPQDTRLILKVRVLMGLGWLEKFGRDHFDRFSAPDFYVRIGIAGAGPDSNMQKTETILDRWHPVWKTNEFEFRLTIPELAVLRVECHDYDDNGRDDFAGQTALPVLEIRPGYRVVPLFDKRGDSLLPVRLLCYFSLTKV